MNHHEIIQEIISRESRSSECDVGGTQYEGGGSNSDIYTDWKGEWTEFSNVNEKIEQNDFGSIFEFLKAIRYKQKKQKKHEIFKKTNENCSIQPKIEPEVEEQKSPGPQEIFNKIFMSKQRNEEDATAKKSRTITAPKDEPHSIIDEVFSWVQVEVTREQIIKRSNTAEKISTPKMNTRSLLSPKDQNSQVCFSPMTLSRAAVKSMGDPTQANQSSGWPILQGHLNIQELILTSDKTVKQFKNLGDMLAVSFLEKHCVKPTKKHYLIFFKGKLYKFNATNTYDQNCKVINIKYCQIDLISLQRPTQTVVFGGKFGGGAQSSGLNLEQCIIIRFQNKCLVLTAATTADSVASKSGVIKKWFELLKYFGVLQNLKCHYDIGNIIGKGNFAQVYEVMNPAKKRKFALKTTNKAMFKDNVKSVLGIHDEISLLRKIRHPNVLQLYEIFESYANIHLILEHLNGKELFDQIKERGYYREKDAATILRCILNALVVLHANQIVHRDLKPENLIFRDENLNSLVIIDFGLSTTCKDGPQFTRCGSPGYVAPEILNNLGYGCKVDIFSVGVIMYILLTSKFVFNAKDYNEILKRNKQCKVYFPKKLWENLSSEAQDLCSRMLQKHPENRISAQEALEHSWFQMYKEKTVPSTSIQESLEQDRMKFLFEEKDKTAAAQDLKDMTYTVYAQEEEKPDSADVRLDLQTSAPIMNKKMMQQNIKEMGIVQLEQDKMNTFQTPLPQLRFANKSNGVDPRLQKLLGGGPAQKNLSNGIVMNNLAGTEASDSMKQRMGLSNNLTQKVNQIQSQNKESLIQKGYMTPTINNSNQFSARKESIELNKNRAALFAMSGIRGGDNIQSQKIKKEEIEDFPKKKAAQQNKAGGTGAADDDNYEDECIASFSDEADDIMSANNSYVSLTLNQQLQRQQRMMFTNNSMMSPLDQTHKSMKEQSLNNSINTILQGINSLITNPQYTNNNNYYQQNNCIAQSIPSGIANQFNGHGRNQSSFSMAQQQIHDNLLKKHIRHDSHNRCSMGPKKNACRHRGQMSHSYDISSGNNKLIARRFTSGDALKTLVNQTQTSFQPPTYEGPSHLQNKLNKQEMQSMYKPTGRMTPLDIAEAMTPPRMMSDDNLRRGSSGGMPTVQSQNNKLDF